MLIVGVGPVSAGEFCVFVSVLVLKIGMFSPTLADV
jgi:hypothetical protein